jgi:tetratricopeptide (TPR) repeat protein
LSSCPNPYLSLILRMHPQIEKFERDFAAFQSNPVNEAEFFSGIWLPVTILPKDEVRVFYRKIYDWAAAHKTETPRIFALATYSLGFVEFHAEDYDKALKYSGEAEKLFSELNDEDGIAICNSTYGGTYRSLGNTELSLKYFSQTFQQLSKTHAFPIFEVISASGIASIYLEMKSYERAIEAFRIAGEIAVRYDNRNFEMISYNGMGEAYHHLGDDEKALEYFNKALEIGKNLGNKNFYSRVLTDIGNFYSDGHDREKAMAYHREALDMREELKMFGGAITNLLFFAGVYTKENNFDAAIEALNKAMKMAEEIKVKPKIFQIHLMLSEIYEQKGDLKTAFDHFKKYQRISEEVYKEDGAKKLQRAEMIFEAEQTKKENVIIKAQKQQIEKANIKLQKTIDELTLSKINRKAKAITTIIAILLFIAEDSILHFVIAPHTHENFFISLAANFAVVFCIKPIERIVEHYLLHRFVKIEKNYEVIGV